MRVVIEFTAVIFRLDLESKDSIECTVEGWYISFATLKGTQIQSFTTVEERLTFRNSR